MPNTPVIKDWSEATSGAVGTVEAYLDAHPRWKEPNFGVFAAHAHMAAQMLEANPSPAMFREFHAAWKALRVALDPKNGDEPTLGELMGDG